MEQNKPTKIHSLDELKTLETGSVIEIEDSDLIFGALYMGYKDGIYKFAVPIANNFVNEYNFTESNINTNNGNIQCQRRYMPRLISNGSIYDTSVERLKEVGLWVDKDSDQTADNSKYKGPDRREHKKPDLSESHLNADRLIEDIMNGLNQIKKDMDKDDNCADFTSKQTPVGYILQERDDLTSSTLTDFMNPRKNLTKSTLDYYMDSKRSRQPTVAGELERRLTEATREERFEDAAMYRDQIKSLKSQK